MDWMPRAYSTDPVASKALRDKMRAEGWDYILQSSHGKYSVTLQHGYGMEYQVLLVDCQDTEELAVAIAALKAKGVNVE